MSDESNTYRKLGGDAGEDAHETRRSEGVREETMGSDDVTTSADLTDEQNRSVGEDGTDRLCRAVYGRSAEPKDYIGGSSAQMLHAAANLIDQLREAVDRLRTASHQVSLPCPDCDGEGVVVAWMIEPKIEGLDRWITIHKTQAELWDDRCTVTPLVRKGR